jgi:CheY-like chemotaxis protein
MKVLVVDDDVPGLEIRRFVLERRGLQVTTAADAASARETFLGSRPDVVVMDLRIPDLESGLALIHAFQGVRIVVLCGNRGDLDGRDERSLVETILQKPIRMEELFSSIVPPVF